VGPTELALAHRQGAVGTVAVGADQALEARPQQGVQGTGTAGASQSEDTPVTATHSQRFCPACF